jgi:ABC-type sugar transport system permease subunit
MAKRPMNRAKRNNLVGWSFLSIWTIGFLVFTLWPIATSILYSFSNVSIQGSGIVQVWIGLENYRRIFSSAVGFDFLRSVADFAIELLFKVPIITVFAIIIALLLNQKIKFRGLFRGIYFLPVIIASGPVINQLISQGAATIPLVEESGLVDLIGTVLTPDLARPIAGIFSQLIVILWFSGVQILLFIAALQKIDHQTYEAAMIDGAGPWESLWKITIPALSNMITVSVIFTVINLATFSENPAIGHIKRNMFAIDTGFGFASAVAWIYFLALAVLLGLAVLLVRGMQKERARR